jgi:hypothetical protein
MGLRDSTLRGQSSRVAGDILAHAPVARFARSRRRLSASPHVIRRYAFGHSDAVGRRPTCLKRDSLVGSSRSMTSCRVVPAGRLGDGEDLRKSDVGRAPVDSANLGQELRISCYGGGRAVLPVVNVDDLVPLGTMREVLSSTSYHKK